MRVAMYFSKRNGLLHRYFLKLNGRSLGWRNLNLTVLINSSVKKQFTEQNDKNLRHLRGHGSIRDKHEVSITHNYSSLRIQSPLIVSAFSEIIKMTFTFHFKSYDFHAAFTHALFTMVYSYPLSRLICLNSHNRLPSNLVAQLVRPL